MLPRYRCTTDRGMGYILLPLTPALSPGERENRPPATGIAERGVCEDVLGPFPKPWKRFPLPKGDGQGEGKRSLRMSRTRRLIGGRAWFACAYRSAVVRPRVSANI